MNKHVVRLLIAAYLVVLACGVYAVTLTNLGEVVTVTTLEEVIAARATPLQDQSIYPEALGRRGTIIRWYDFDVHGSGTNISLEPGGGYSPAVCHSNLIGDCHPVPDNTLILGGYIQVVEVCSPATDVAVGVCSANDLFDGTTAFLTNGLYAITPAWTVASAVQTTNRDPVRVGFAGDQPTQGMFMLWMDCSLIN